MKKRKWLMVLALILCFVCVAYVVAPQNAWADVGDHNDYGSDSGSDYGGGDSGDFIWILLWALQRPERLILVAIAALIYFLYRKFVKGKVGTVSGTTTGRYVPSNPFPDNTAKIAATIQAKDPAFSAQNFITWAKEAFVQLQLAWTRRDWKLARPFESDSLFKTHQLQLEDHIRNRRTNVIENISVNTAYLIDYVADAEYEYLTMYLEAKMTDYYRDDETGQVLRGDPKLVYRMKYRLKFMRSVDVITTPSTSNKSTTNCPNCGAPTDITSSGECAYCGSVITTGKFDWVLCEINSL